MLKFLSLFFVMSSMLFSAQSLKLDLVTGEKGGTYYEFGQDIASVVSSEVKVNNISTGGTIENLLGLVEDKYSGFIIVQDDVLNYIRVNKRNSLKLIKKFKENATPDNLEALISNIKVVFPLYAEEVHVLVKKDGDIKKISDLNGKKINVGSKLGGSRLTGAIILSIASVKAEKLHYDNKEAIQKLLTGELDAVILVGGAPLKFLEEMDKKTNLTLLSIQSKELDGYYYNSVIKASTYPWLENNVKTYATRSVLITTASTTSLTCAAKKRTVEAILKGLKKLKDYEHKKWEQVDPSLEVKGWSREKCVAPIIEKWSKEKAKMKKIMKKIKNP